MTVTCTLPVAAAAPGLDCVRNKSWQALNFVPYLCTSCLVIATQSQFLAFLGFAAVSVGKNQRKTQTSRYHKAYKCDWVLFMFIFEGEEVKRGSCSWFSRSEEQNYFPISCASRFWFLIYLNLCVTVPATPCPQVMAHSVSQSCRLLEKPTSHFLRLKFYWGRLCPVSPVCQNS